MALIALCTGDSVHEPVHDHHSERLTSTTERHHAPRKPSICVWVEFNGDPRNADQIWMIGAAVCLRVAGHDVIRPRPSEVPRASVALRPAATPARATLSRPAGRTRGTGPGRMVHQARHNSGS
jgi:hypothetical protein